MGGEWIGETRYLVAPRNDAVASFRQARRYGRAILRFGRKPFDCHIVRFVINEMPWIGDVRVAIEAGCGMVMVIVTVDVRSVGRVRPIDMITKAEIMIIVGR